MTTSTMIIRITYLSILALLMAMPLASQNAVWTPSYFPGTADTQGQVMGGNEVMQLVAHKGRLFAGNSYSMDLDSISNPGAAQIVRLDGPAASWQQDKAFTADNPRIGAMKSFVFTTNFLGTAITPDTLLIALPSDDTGQFDFWVRDDQTGAWMTDNIASLSGAIHCEAIGFHQDIPNNNASAVFAGLMNFGIVRGRYDPAQPAKLLWSQVPEFISIPNERVTGFAVCNNSLYASTSGGGVGHIYLRLDVFRQWNLVKTVNGGGSSDDIRGLSAIPNPNGTGQVLWYTWAGKTMRMDVNNNFQETIEYAFVDSLSAQLGIPVQQVKAAYNDQIPNIESAAPNEDIRVIGFGLKYDSIALVNDPRPNWNGWATDGQYYERHQAGSNIWYVRRYIVNNDPQVLDTLLATRSLCVSPFPSDSARVLYAGGMDCNGIPMRGQAWVYRGEFPGVVTGAASQPKPVVPTAYPNPFVDRIQVRGSDTDAVLTLYDAVGRVHYTGASLAEQDLSQLPSGTYLLRIQHPSQVACLKLIKQ